MPNVLTPIYDKNKGSIAWNMFAWNTENNITLNQNKTVILSKFIPDQYGLLQTVNFSDFKACIIHDFVKDITPNQKKDKTYRSTSSQEEFAMCFLIYRTFTESAKSVAERLSEDLELLCYAIYYKRTEVLKELLRTIENLERRNHQGYLQIINAVFSFAIINQNHDALKIIINQFNLMNDETTIKNTLTYAIETVKLPVTSVMRAILEDKDISILYIISLINLFSTSKGSQLANQSIQIAKIVCFILVLQRANTESRSKDLVQEIIKPYKDQETFSIECNKTIDSMTAEQLTELATLLHTENSHNNTTLSLQNALREYIIEKNIFTRNSSDNRQQQITEKPGTPRPQDSNNETNQILDTNARKPGLKEKAYAADQPKHRLSISFDDHDDLSDDGLLIPSTDNNQTHAAETPSLYIDENSTPEVMRKYPLGNITDADVFPDSFAKQSFADCDNDETHLDYESSLSELNKLESQTGRYACILFNQKLNAPEKITLLNIFDLIHLDNTTSSRNEIENILFEILKYAIATSKTQVFTFAFDTYFKQIKDDFSKKTFALRLAHCAIHYKNKSALEYLLSHASSIEYFYTLEGTYAGIYSLFFDCIARKNSEMLTLVCQHIFHDDHQYLSLFAATRWVPRYPEKYSPLQIIQKICQNIDENSNDLVFIKTFLKIMSENGNQNLIDIFFDAKKIDCGGISLTNPLFQPSIFTELLHHSTHHDKICYLLIAFYDNENKASAQVVVSNITKFFKDQNDFIQQTTEMIDQFPDDKIEEYKTFFGLEIKLFKNLDQQMKKIQLKNELILQLKNSLKISDETKWANNHHLTTLNTGKTSGPHSCLATQSTIRTITGDFDTWNTASIVQLCNPTVEALYNNVEEIMAEAELVSDSVYNLPIATPDSMPQAQLATYSVLNAPDVIYTNAEIISEELPLATVAAPSNSNHIKPYLPQIQTAMFLGIIENQNRTPRRYLNDEIINPILTHEECRVERTFIERLKKSAILLKWPTQVAQEYQNTDQNIQKVRETFQKIGSIIQYYVTNIDSRLHILELCQVLSCTQLDRLFREENSYPISFSINALRCFNTYVVHFGKETLANEYLEALNFIDSINLATNQQNLILKLEASTIQPLNILQEYLRFTWILIKADFPPKDYARYDLMLQRALFAKYDDQSQLAIILNDLHSNILAQYDKQKTQNLNHPLNNKGQNNHNTNRAPRVFKVIADLYLEEVDGKTREPLTTVSQQPRYVAEERQPAPTAPFVQPDHNNFFGMPDIQRMAPTDNNYYPSPDATSNNPRIKQPSAPPALPPNSTTITAGDNRPQNTSAHTDPQNTDRWTPVKTACLSAASVYIPTAETSSGFMSRLSNISIFRSLHTVTETAQNFSAWLNANTADALDDKTKRSLKHHHQLKIAIKKAYNQSTGGSETHILEVLRQLQTMKQAAMPTPSAPPLPTGGLYGHR